MLSAYQIALYGNQAQHVAFNREPRRDYMDLYWTRQTQHCTPVDEKQRKNTLLNVFKTVYPSVYNAMFIQGTRVQPYRSFYLS